ncbi:MAG: glutathione peroxidase, partial [Marmoricola sp.]
MTSLSDFSARTLTGQEQDLAAYAGSVVLVVNTASKCGFTPQFEGLESLYEKYVDAGLVVLGFPCNQFASQDPGTSDEIGEFCQKNYGVSFPMMEKVDVNGEDAHPLYQWMKAEKGGVLGEKIKWNFTKFLIGRDGQVIKRYGSTT